MLKRPPRLAISILKCVLPPNDQEHLLGDYEESFHRKLEEKNALSASLWYWGQLLHTAPEYILESFYWRIVMFKNYVKIALRNIKLNKTFSFINISGLAIGLACCLLILLWIQDELSYDNFHKNGKQIYRITTSVKTQNRTTHHAGSPAPLGPELLRLFPEIVDFTRVQSGWDGWRLHYNEKWFYKEKLAAVDPSFFQMFSFQFIAGDPKRALQDKDSIVITEQIAQKCFGTDDPIGKIMKISDNDMKVTGVIKKIPKNSHLQFDYAFSAENMRDWRGSLLDSWDYLQFATYIQLRPDARISEVTNKMNELVGNNVPKMKAILNLQPLSHIHLRSSLYNSWMVVYPQPGNITFVYIFSLIAICILLLACINFMNLTTARSMGRSREVGIRKVVGAGRKDIFLQYMGESILLTFVATIAAVLILSFIIPSFNTISGKNLSLQKSGNMEMILSLLAVTLITGLLSGSYPSIFLSSFQPIKVLSKIGGKGSKRGTALRRILVIIQFAFTIGLIITSSVIYRQMNFIKNKDLGFDKDHIIVFDNYLRNPDVMTEKLKNNPNILNVSYSEAPNERLYGSVNFSWDGQSSEDNNIMFYPVSVDYEYLDTFKIKMAEGRFYSEDFPTDAKEALVINQTAANAMGMRNPLGKRITFTDPRTRGIRTNVVIGLIKDFHISPLRNSIEPLIFNYNKNFHRICVRIHPENVESTIQHIESVWKSLVEGRSFEYEFLNERIDNFYKKEKKAAVLILNATILSIIIALLGLFGLASHTTEQRTKEIGIRKVLGAPVPSIIMLLVKDINRGFLIANLIAWPIAYLVVRTWLNNFSYNTGISPWLFILSSLFALFIALFTVIHQVIKSARKNPVKTLRYE
jgi:ABC-type antimicrobial peptide transport system permease subunit